MSKETKKDKKSVVKKEYIIADDLKDIALKVCQSENLDLRPAKLKFIKVYPYISKSIAGRCLKANDLLKFFGEFDYLIQMSGDLWDNLPADTQETLMLHELMHVYPQMNEKTGDWNFKILDHDLKDFSKITDRYGTNWIKTIKAINGSINNLNPKEEDNFTI